MSRCLKYSNRPRKILAGRHLLSLVRTLSKVWPELIKRKDNIQRPASVVYSKKGGVGVKKD